MLCMLWQRPNGDGGVVSAGLAVLSTAVPRGYCHHVHGISTRNSAQIIVPIFYTLM